MGSWRRLYSFTLLGEVFTLLAHVSTLPEKVSTLPPSINEWDLGDVGTLSLSLEKSSLFLYTSPLFLERSPLFFYLLIRSRRRLHSPRRSLWAVPIIIDWFPTVLSTCPITGDTVSNLPGSPVAGCRVLSPRLFLFFFFRMK